MKSNFKLGREMKLALTGVALVGAVGGWSVWNAGRPSEVDSAPTTSTSAPSETQPADGGVTVSRPNKPVDVQPIPFLNTAQALETPGEETAAPAPSAPQDAELANPFRPFTVAATARQGGSANVASGALPAPTIPNVPSRSAPAPSAAPAITASAPPAPAMPNLSAPIPVPSLGIVSAPPLPGSVPVPVVPSSQAARPVPVAPSTQLARPVPVLPSSPAVVPPTPLPQNAAPFPTQGSASVITAAPMPTPMPVPKPLPKPPIPTVRAPTVATLTTPVALPPEASSAPPVEAPVANVPPLLAEVQPVAEETGASAPSLPSDPLDAYVTEQNLIYNAVVLGPVNTVIFQSKTGYSVLSLGQKLPDSDIVITDISASSVTLTLGDSLKTLELDKR